MGRFECAICQGTRSDAAFCALNCGHCFHTVCVYQWLERSPTCPGCRASAKKRHVRALNGVDAVRDGGGSSGGGETQPQLDTDHHQQQQVSALQQSISVGGGWGGFFEYQHCRPTGRDCAGAERPAAAACSSRATWTGAGSAGAAARECAGHPQGQAAEIQAQAGGSPCTPPCWHTYTPCFVHKRTMLAMWCADDSRHGLMQCKHCAGCPPHAGLPSTLRAVPRAVCM